MEIRTLASGSSGNAYIVSDGTTVLMLECGLPIRRLMAEVRRAGYRLAQLDACLITHEHGDHCRAAHDLAQWGTRLVCTAGTAAAAGLTDVLTARPLTPMQIGSFDALPLPMDHDAAEPVGWLLSSRETGERLLFATDTARLEYHVEGLTHIMVECNHLPERMGDTNAVLSERICRSHLSLAECLRFLERQDLSGVQEIRLIHLSASHGDPDEMRRAVARLTGRQVTVEERR